MNNHWSRLLRSHRKNRPSILKSNPRATNRPTANQIDRLKFSWSMREVENWV